jgi:3-oxoacyl-ACP reductase-like protein
MAKKRTWVGVKRTGSWWKVDGAERTVVCVAVAVGSRARPAGAVASLARSVAAVVARVARRVDARRSAAAASGAARGRGGGDERDDEDCLDHMHLGRVKSVRAERS